MPCRKRVPVSGSYGLFQHWRCHPNDIVLQSRCRSRARCCRETNEASSHTTSSANDPFSNVASGTFPCNSCTDRLHRKSGHLRSDIDCPCICDPGISRADHSCPGSGSNASPIFVVAAVVSSGNESSYNEPGNGSARSNISSDSYSHVGAYNPSHFSADFYTCYIISYVCADSSRDFVSNSYPFKSTDRWANAPSVTDSDFDSDPRPY